MKNHDHGRILFRGADIGQVLRKLESCEAGSNLFATSQDKIRPFFLDGWSKGIICSYAQRFIHLNALKKIHKDRRPLEHFYRPVARTNSKARTVKVKNNVLSFYPCNMILCKSWRPSGIRPYSALLNEAAAIAVAEKLNIFRVPRIVVDQSSNDSGNEPAIWYEKIKGRKPEAGDIRKKCAVSFLESMFKWYEEHSLELKKTFEIFTKKPSLEDLSSWGWSEHEAETITRALNRVSQIDKLMHISWIHGDASVVNCIINTENQIVILDWEMTKRDIIVRDIAKLIRQGGAEAQILYSAWLKRVSTRHTDILELVTQEHILNIVNNFNPASRMRQSSDDPVAAWGKNKTEAIKKQVLDSARTITGMYK